MSERLYFSSIVLLGFTLIAICNSDKLNSNETEARLFAKETSDKLFKYFEDLETYEDFTGDEYVEDNEDEREEEDNFFADISKDVKKFDYKNFKDKELEFAFKAISKMVNERGETYNELSNLFDELDTISEIESIKEYGNTSELLAYYPEVSEIIETSSNPDELEYYWEEARKTSGNWAKENLKHMLEELKDLPDITRFFRNSNFTEMERLMTEIQPIYLELHAFIRNLLKKKYDDSIIKSDGLIPDHLFEQVIAQAWTNESVIEEMYPYDDIPSVDDDLEKRFNSTKELYKIADKFYQSLGFEKFPSKVWEDYIKLRETENEDDICHTRVHFWTPKVRLEYCEEISLHGFLKAYYYLGQIHYAKEMTGLPAYFFQTYDLDFAIGTAAMLSASTYHNLKATGMISEDFTTTEELEMNNLLRMTIERLMKIPVDLVHTKLITDLLSGKTELKDLNKQYWQLMQKYVGVGPPVNHKTGADTLDMPYSFYDDMKDIVDNHDNRLFDTEIVSYQFYKKLCMLSLKYPAEPLHMCDIHGNKDAGDALRSMMRLGASKPYDEVLAFMFDENPKISADGIVEYYSPVKKMLTKKNKEENVKSGWKHSENDSRE